MKGLVLCQQWIDGWPGLEGASPKPRGFLRSAQSSPGHPDPSRHHCQSTRRWHLHDSILDAAEFEAIKFP